MQKTPIKEPTRLSRATVAVVWLAAAAVAILILLVAAGSAEGGIYRAAQCNPGLGAGRGDFTFERNSDHYASEADCEGPGLVVRHRNRSSRRDRWGAWTLPAPTGLLFTVDPRAGSPAPPRTGTCRSSSPAFRGRAPPPSAVRAAGRTR